MAKTTKKATTKKAASVKKTAKKAADTAVKKTTAKKTATAAVAVKVDYPDKFTNASMIGYVAAKNGLTKNQAKDIIDSVFDIIDKGVLTGSRVPIGKFGKMYVKIRPARKARKGRNPITGAEMVIAAKKATKVPKFTFSKAYKETALKAKVTGK